MSKLPKMTADEIRSIRDKLGKPQREMAELLGVDLRSYQRWEGSERPMRGPAVLLSRLILRDHENVNKESV